VSDAPDPLVELVMEEPGWKVALPEIEDVATRAAGLALDAAGLSPDAYSVSVLACDDARIAALNAAFRGKAEPTNVLSWPAFPLAPPSQGAAPPAPPAASARGARLPLGDVAIALQTVNREAGELGRPLKNHAMHLILHGCLHLLGYDHETPRDAELMEDLERRALARARIPDPYE
jgi:probable rRNA maturation factor